MSESSSPPANESINAEPSSSANPEIPSISKATTEAIAESWSVFESLYQAVRSAPSVDEFLKFLDDELDTITLFSVTKKLCQKWSLVPAIELDELWIGVEVPDGRKFANAISFRTYISGSLRVYFNR